MSISVEKAGYEDVRNILVPLDWWNFEVPSEIGPEFDDLSQDLEKEIPAIIDFNQTELDLVLNKMKNSKRRRTSRPETDEAEIEETDPNSRRRKSIISLNETWGMPEIETENNNIKSKSNGNKFDLNN